MSTVVTSQMDIHEEKKHEAESRTDLVHHARLRRLEVVQACAPLFFARLRLPNLRHLRLEMLAQEATEEEGKDKDEEGEEDVRFYPAFGFAGDENDDGEEEENNKDGSTLAIVTTAWPPCEIDAQQFPKLVTLSLANVTGGVLSPSLLSWPLCGMGLYLCVDVCVWGW